MDKFLKFGTIGILNTGITIVSFMILIYFNMNYIVANIVAYSLGIINSYYWNNNWVFQTKTKKLNVFLKFILVNLITLSVNTVVLFILVDRFALHSVIGQIVATGCGLVINFFINKSWTFKVIDVEEKQ